MRTSTGCHECRDRHLKCVFKSGSDRCNRCTETARECVRGLTIRFRPVTAVRKKRTAKKKGPHDKGKDCKFNFNSTQIWVKVPPAVTFAPPASSLEDLEDELRLDDAGSSPRSFTPEDDRLQEAVAPFNDTSLTDHSNPAVTAAAGSINALLNLEDQSPLATLAATAEVHGDFDVYRPQLPLHQENNHRPSPPTNESSSDFWSPISPLYQFSTGWPLKTREEARLFQHYVRDLAVWVDCCDDGGQFGTVVPQRAANYPVLMNAILALSSRHLSRLSGTEDIDSPQYMSQCLEMLIPVLDDPLGSLDENLLAAIVILRLYEESDEIDEKCHLYGGTRLLNSIARFVPSGGLGEAASWIFLRQDIYVSLTTGQPLNIDLDNYLSSQAFQKDTPGAWANRMVYIFAKILNYACQQDEAPSKEKWQQLEEEVETWEKTKPWHFRPLWEKSPDSDDLPFPEIWMTLPAHVVGRQHYNMSKILLATCDPKLSQLGFNGHRSRKASEVRIVENLKAVIGVAIGNEGVPAGIFHASHILCAFGSYLEKESEREAAVDFLQRGMKGRIGWNSSRIIASLRDQWQM